MKKSVALIIVFMAVCLYGFGNDSFSSLSYAETKINSYAYVDGTFSEGYTAASFEEYEPEEKLSVYLIYPDGSDRWFDNSYLNDEIFWSKTESTIVVTVHSNDGTELNLSYKISTLLHKVIVNDPPYDNNGIVDIHFNQYNISDATGRLNGSDIGSYTPGIFSETVLRIEGATNEETTITTNLDIHIPSLIFHNQSEPETQSIWADFQFYGEGENSEMLWKLVDFGTNEAEAPHINLLDPEVNNMHVLQNGATNHSGCGDHDMTWCQNRSDTSGYGPFLFDWGDGSKTCDGFAGEHTYTSSGLFDIYVSIKNTCGSIATESKTVSISNN